MLRKRKALARNISYKRNLKHFSLLFFFVTNWFSYILSQQLEMCSIQLINFVRETYVDLYIV